MYRWAQQRPRSSAPRFSRFNSQRHFFSQSQLSRQQQKRLLQVLAEMFVNCVKGLGLALLLIGGGVAASGAP